MITVGTDFSGIGAIEQVLKEMDIEHEVVFACEKDKYARETYLANHKTNIMYEDIKDRDNTKAPYCDLYVFGFPCQAFSIAGHREGFNDIRGTLFFNSAEYIKMHRPKVFIAENVKGLINHDKVKGSKSKCGRTFTTIINLLAKTVNGQVLIPSYTDNLGYNIFHTVLNTKHYNLPQNRERVFIVGFREDVHFSFPNSKTVSKCLADILEEDVPEKYYLSEKIIAGMKLSTEKNKEKGRMFAFTPISDPRRAIAKCIRSNVHKMAPDDNYIQDVVQLNESTESGGVQPYQQNRVYDTRGISPAHLSQLSSKSHAILIRYGKSQDQTINDINGVSQTLSGGHYNQPKIADKERIRRLTERECLRLQGFPDSFLTPCSGTQTYKQAGNTISLTVLKEIIKRIKF